MKTKKQKLNKNLELKVGDKVAYESKRNEFSTGIIKYIDKVNGKAQVKYDHNNTSYWINIDNLYKVEKNK